MFALIDDLLVKASSYVIARAKLEKVPNDKISSLIKTVNDFIQNPDNKPGTKNHEKYKAGFRYRLNDYANGLFENEPDVLIHMGGERFSSFVDEVVTVIRLIIERLVEMP
jgi:hypothetical protein